MLPMQFAIEFETVITNQLTELAVTADSVPLITLIEQCQREVLSLLATANTINIDIAAYPPVNESQLLGADGEWQQVASHNEAGSASLKLLVMLWTVNTLLDKTAQFYQQAAANNAHPQTRLFFNSLSHIKRILVRRVNSTIQIYCNHYWGELGFAPFMLGKD